MAVCRRCGEANPERARFCLGCGAPLAESEPPETRKTVTVLFSDITGSTALAEQLDAESLRRVMSRYFDRMEAVLEQHGGTVEKFIGDAIMAVFGIPSLHEDDGARAVRAASEMREALALLNEELDRDYGVRIAIRTGINTGEVVAGDPSAGQKLVTGDAVNVAARLEQAASPGEVLIGPETQRLVRDAARLEEAVEPLELRGKTDRIPAWRLVEVLPDVPAFGRRIGTPFVGRADELAALERALDLAVQEQSCTLATIVGPPGIGKSRIARELVQSVGESARVVVGRCLPYGDGITYWPLAEIVRQVAGSDPRAGLEQLVAGEADARLIASRVASAIGVADTAGPAEETAWSFRKLFETLARDRPLLAIVDDIHWAEPTLLDLLEYVVSFSSGAPILLLCLARPEMFELRPSWSEPRPNSTLITLKPLSEEESERLVERLLDTRDLAKPARARIVEAAAGNPLFVEQMLAMQAESPEDGELVVPPTIQALLAARIDRLPPRERAVIERASVEGRMFHRSAVAELLPNGAQHGLGADLMSLVRKEFIRPDEALFQGDDGFRFGHILIRDAAYESMPKALRADLHERFAAWLERKAASHEAEYEEILGYHLEQAFKYRLQLGPADVRANTLAKRGAARLRSAGERAVARGDMPGAANLIGRAVDLLPESDPTRVELLPELGTALIEVGELARAVSTFELALEPAQASGDERAAWRARLGRALAQVWMGGSQEEAGAVAEEAAEALARLDDELGVARACNLLALARFWRGSAAVADEIFNRALEHSRRARSPREEAQALTWRLITSWMGPAPVAEAVARCREIGERAPTRQVEAFALLEQGPLLAMQGRFTEARELFREGRAMLEDLGLAIFVAGSSQEYFDLEMLAGDPAGAEADLRRACESLERLGEKGFLSTRAGCLAHALCAQGRYDEADEFIELAADSASADDAATQALWRSAKAKVVARRGEVEEALTLAREAVAILEPTDWLSVRADGLVDLGEILRLADRPAEARAALEAAVTLYEEKGNIAAAGKTRGLLDDVRAPVA